MNRKDTNRLLFDVVRLYRSTGATLTLRDKRALRLYYKNTSRRDIKWNYQKQYWLRKRGSPRPENERGYRIPFN